MIYTVTFNPAVDYVMRFRTLRGGEVNRSESEEIYFGGKGINVSLILGQLGVETTALGFLAGFTGKAVEEGVKALGISADFVWLEEGFTRINVKIKSDCETELNGQGPKISGRAISELFEKLDRLQKGDTLVLAGSIPNTLPSDMYERILERLSGRGIRFAADASRDLLKNVLKYEPFLIKPNIHELGELFGVKISGVDEVKRYALKLREMGAVNVLVSMAGDGSVLADENGNFHVMGVPEGKAVNSVGAGDSMLAGFLAGYLEKEDYSYALRLGTAAGSATAFSSGLAEREHIYRLLELLK